MKHDGLNAQSTAGIKKMQWVSAAIAGLLGLIIGSFLNVVIHRGPALWKLVDDEPRPRGSLAFPRSYCPACGVPLKTTQLIPIVSYLVQRGRCAACAASISLRYPLVELMGAIAGLTAYLLFGPDPGALFAAIFFWSLIALAVIDFETGYLPDALTLPLIGLGLLANAFGFFGTFSDAVIGAAAGYAALRGVAVIFKKLRGMEGLGHGDAKLLAAIGAWAGWAALAPTVFIAALLGLGGVIILKLRGRKIAAETPIPFGPALAAAGAAIFIAMSSGAIPAFR